MATRIKLLSAIAIAATVVVVAGCSNSPAPEPTISLSPSAQASLAANGVSAAGVVLAGLLISTGEVSHAVEKGLVTPEEVDLAQTAIKDGTLKAWATKAAEEAAAK